MGLFLCNDFQEGVFLTRTDIPFMYKK